MSGHPHFCTLYSVRDQNLELPLPVEVHGTGHSNNGHCNALDLVVFCGPLQTSILRKPSQRFAGRVDNHTWCTHAE